MQPKWDTTLGLKMYQEGQSDKEIANHFGISVSTVSYQRRKFWEVTEDCPPREEAESACSPEDLKADGLQVSVQSSAERRLDIYEVLEAATCTKQGIMAICTAEAIRELWRWNSMEDLLKARDAIDYLIKKLEEA